MRLMLAALSALMFAVSLPASVASWSGTAPLVLTQSAVQPLPPAPVAAQGWPVVDGPNRVFSVTMPIGPIYVERNGNHIYLAHLPDTEFSAQFTLLPAEAVSNPRSNLERAVTNMPSRFPSKAWETIAWSTFQGADAVEVTGFANSNLHVRMFMILKARQYYVFGYSGPRGSARSADADRYFNSVRIRP